MMNAALNEKPNCLQLLAEAIPGVERTRLEELVDSAWHEDSECCLPLMFRLESQDKKNFYRGMTWLFKNHVDTLMANLVLMADASGIQCLLDLLMFVMHEPGTGRRQYSLEASWNNESRSSDHTISGNAGLKILKQCSQRKWKVCKSEPAADLDVDEKKRKLYETIADIIANGLRAEKEACENGQHVGGQFCLNAPSGQRMHDKATGIVAGVASRLFTDESCSKERKIRYQRLLTMLRLAANNEASQSSATVRHCEYDRMARMARPKSGNKSGGKSRPGCCFKCGRAGHWKHECAGDFETKTVTIQVKSSDTIRQVKAKIEESEGTPCSQQELIFHGKRVEEHDMENHERELWEYVGNVGRVLYVSNAYNAHRRDWDWDSFELKLQFQGLLIFLHPPKPGYCYCCGEQGHWKSTCPMLHFFKRNNCHPPSTSSIEDQWLGIGIMSKRWSADRIQYSGLSEDVAVCRQNRRTPCYRVPNTEIWRDRKKGKTSGLPSQELVKERRLKRSKNKKDRDVNRKSKLSKTNPINVPTNAPADENDIENESEVTSLAHQCARHETCRTQSKKKSKKTTKTKHQNEVFNSNAFELGEHSRSELQSHLTCIARLERQRCIARLERQRG